MKKIKILTTIISFVLALIIHNMHKWFPSFITSIFFPVNESIWEHMKIIYTGIMIISVIEYFIYNKANIKYNNFLLAFALPSIIGIIMYLIIYLIIDIFIPHNLVVAIVLLYLDYIFIQILSYIILNMPKCKNSQYLGFFLIITSYLIFLYLTYHPIHNKLFIDTRNNTYGIHKNNN